MYFSTERYASFKRMKAHLQGGIYRNWMFVHYTSNKYRQPAGNTSADLQDTCTEDRYRSTADVG